MLETPVMTLTDVSHVTFKGLTWKNGRGDGVIVQGGSSCLLAGCTIRQFGGNGVEIQGGAHHGLLSCDIAMLGRGGTVVTGGDRKTLTPGGHFVENCHIDHFSLVDHTYTPAVLLSGVGNRISHCLIHDSYSSAIRIEGNDHLVEYNEVRDVVRESDDQGGSDMWGNPTFRGNVFRYNYWHDIGNTLGVGQAGIRLDDWISGVVIYGNIFQRCARGNFGGIQINQGSDNLIENNVFADCRTAVSGGANSAEARMRFLSGAQGKGYIEEVNATHDATIVLTTHDLAEAERLCGRITVLNEGRVVAEDTPDGLKATTAERLGRPATLEDVFMTYTGRSLDDDIDEDDAEPDGD